MARPVPLSVAARVGGLSIDLTVGLTRLGRTRCPSCGLRRILYRLSAFADDQPIGHGIAICLPCAGLRQHRQAA